MSAARVGVIGARRRRLARQPGRLLRFLQGRRHGHEGRHRDGGRGELRRGHRGARRQVDRRGPCDDREGSGHRRRPLGTVATLFSSTDLLTWAPINSSILGYCRTVRCPVELLRFGENCPLHLLLPVSITEFLGES